MKRFLFLPLDLIAAIMLLCVGYNTYRNMQDIEKIRREAQSFSNGIETLFEAMKGGKH